MSTQRYLALSAAGIAVGVMLILMWTMAGMPWIGGDLVKPEVPDSTSPVTFVEVVEALDDTRALTDLQVANLLHQYVGTRVHWDGYVGGVQDPFFDRIPVRLYPEPVTFFEYRGRLFPEPGGISSQIYFPDRQKRTLLDLALGQRIRVACRFDKILDGNIPILKDCHLMTVTDPNWEKEGVPDETAGAGDTGSAEEVD